MGGWVGRSPSCSRSGSRRCMRRIGLRDEFGASGTNDALLEKFGLTPRRVADQVVAFLAERVA